MFKSLSLPSFMADEFSEGEFIPIADQLEAKDVRAGRPKIIVVDDQRLIADTMAEILEGAGFHAIPAYDGWAALEVAARFKPDFLLSDVLMPHMNGVQLAIAIRRNYPKTRILLFSGQAGISKIVEEGQQQGYDFELVAKPIHPLKLIERLRDQK